MRIALVHDHLNQAGGAEQVLNVFHKTWPTAPIFTLLHDTDRIDLFKDADVRPSFLQSLPFAKSLFRLFLPLMPTATESYDLADYDIVISSVSAFAKGIITKPDTLHLCYCHTPTRYLWSDTREYLEELRAPRFVKWFLPFLFTRLRVWDRLAAERVDTFVANSETVARRIQKYYGKDSTVIHPPVNVAQFSLSDAPKTYYLAGGRLVAYKRFDIIVDAFTKLGWPLKIFGTGPMETSLRKRAGANIEFLGRVDEAARTKLYQDAIAYIHPQEEDFGITPVESMASGRPVIAYRRGGVLESIEEDVTGVFFDHQDWEALASTLRAFDESRFNPKTIREHAFRYSEEAFIKTFRAFVHDAYATHQKHLNKTL